MHGYLETLSLKDAVLAPDERRRYLGIALAQSRRSGNWPRRCLSWRVWSMARCACRSKIFPSVDLIQDVFQKFELMAETRQSKLLAALPRGASMVSADLGMIERVLTNLIDNALRHTPEGGTIEVALAHGRGKLQVTVSDTGPGIAPTLLENLFRRPFNQDGDRRSGGLGLLIVRRILQLHDSQIRLLSVPGKGAVFYFELTAVG